MNPKEFLDTARRLLDSAQNEGDLRTAVSRAYYMIYHSIRIELLKSVSISLIQQAGLGSKNAIAHERLASSLTGCKKTSQIGEDLSKLRVARHKADYALTDTVAKKWADEQFHNAEALLKNIEAFGGPMKVVEALKAYLQQLHPGG